MFHWKLIQGALKDVTFRSGEACRFCDGFVNEPDLLEEAIPGLTSFSSAYGSTRSDDGLCRRHDRYVRASFSCSDYVPYAPAIRTIGKA